MAAALDARTDDDLLVVARTDARAPLGLDAAIERANRYAQAGADVIFVEAPQSIEEIERIAREVQAPLLINLVLGGMTPLESATRLQELGYAIAIHPSNPLARAVLGMLEGLCELNGGNVADHLPTRPAEFFNLVGMAEWLALDAKYARLERQLMGMTIIEKIFARKAGLDRVSPGETVVVDVDMTVLIDLQFATMWIEPLRIHDPDKLAIVMDHAVPAPTIKDAAGGPHARKFAKDFGIERFYDVGRHGICHQVIAENGLARPGEILACTDSHTCAAGAYNTAARGLGPAEVYSIMCTGSTWFQVAPTIRYQFDGVKPDTVSGKDIFLHIANEYGDAANLNLEFGGPGLASIPMHDRRTIATQGAEVSADFSTFEPDQVLTSFLDDRGVTGYHAAAADSDAAYQEVRRVDLAALEPYVARPGTVSRNGLPVSQMERQKIDQAFIGSCANGQLEDLEIAAEILRGNTVAPGVRLLVTPASQAVYREAMRRGYLQDIADAGAVITNSTCGACFGYHMGVVGPGEVCLTSSTRNFTGRMGSTEAQIFMASPATVAASALTGYITDARSVTA